MDLDALIAEGRAARVDLAWPDDGFGEYADFFEMEAAPLLPGVAVFAEEPATLHIDLDGGRYRVDLAGSDAEESGYLDPLVVAAVDLALGAAGSEEGLALVVLDECEAALVRYSRADPAAALQALGLPAPPDAGLHPVPAGPDEAGAWAFLEPGDAAGLAAALGGAAALEAGVADVLRHLRAGRKVVAPGVGTLTVRTRRARRGRDPETGAPVVIPAVHNVGFRVGKALKEALAGTAAWEGAAGGDPGAALLQAVARVLLSGEAAMAPGVGTWRSTQSRERRGRNPATGEELVIAARMDVRFTPDPELVAALSG